MKELAFLEIIKDELKESSRYIGDDTAYIAEKDLIVTQDTLVEDIHFRTRTISPFYLGRKSIAVNLSDIAAAGGVPQYALISLSMPKSIEDKFVKEFYKGVNSICREYGVLVVGGDITGAEKIAISVCAMGSGEGLQPANRRNALTDEVVILVGKTGASAAGLELLENSFDISREIKTKLIETHVNPVPLVKEGRKILELAGKPAMMDLSDGLADALYKICELSSVSMEVDFSEITYDSDIYKVFSDKNSAKNAILFGGEDYALLATVSQEVYENLQKEIPVKKIGVVKPPEAEPCAYVRFNDGTAFKIDVKALDAGVFNHFKE